MSKKAADRGETGYTPNEEDFCACGFTFPKWPGAKLRACPGCGAVEIQRMSFHRRTRVPYQNLSPAEWLRRYAL